MKYTTKRFLRWIAYSPQSARWISQEPTLKKLWRGKIATDKKYLDIGCGGGTYAIECFFKRGAKATLVEYDDKNRRITEKQVEQSGFASLATVTADDAEDLKLPSNEFDGIQCIEVLEHIYHPDRALREMWRVSKEGANLIVSVPHPPEWVPNKGHITKGFTKEELSKLMQENGWEVVEVRYCMLILSRLFSLLSSRGIRPHGLNWLLMLESLVPVTLKYYFLPQDIMILAKRSKLN